LDDRKPEFQTQGARVFRKARKGILLPFRLNFADFAKLSRAHRLLISHGDNRSIKVLSEACYLAVAHGKDMNKAAGVLSAGVLTRHL
jgi:hypothetical protein